nr:MAG TPA: hypothetical protein [Caudoviricetes sp.]
MASGLLSKGGFMHRVLDTCTRNGYLHAREHVCW